MYLSWIFSLEQQLNHKCNLWNLHDLKLFFLYFNRMCWTSRRTCFVARSRRPSASSTTRCCRFSRKHPGTHQGTAGTGVKTTGTQKFMNILVKKVQMWKGHIIKKQESIHGYNPTIASNRRYTDFPNTAVFFGNFSKGCHACRKISWTSFMYFNEPSAVVSTVASANRWQKQTS